MAKPKHSKQRARIAKRKEKGRLEYAENNDRAMRNYERSVMHFLVYRKQPKHGGLEPARVDDLAKALETPDPLPSTPEDIEADRQRRSAAMAEINAAIDKLPEKGKRGLEMLRARKPGINSHQIGKIPLIPRPTMHKDFLSPQKPRTKAAEARQGEPEWVKDDGPKYGEPYSVTKEEWEEQHWNKTRELREEEQRKDNEVEDAVRTQEHEAFMKKMMAEIEEAERY